MDRKIEHPKDSKSEPIYVNPALVWDYEIPPLHEQTEAFRRWYIARVLTRGRISDLQSLGLSTIYRYWPALQLPAHVQRFWHWYLNLPEIKQRYGNFDPIPASGADRHWSDIDRT